MSQEKTNKTTKTTFFAIMIGNVLDHYDIALYTFLVPFIAPIFFQNDDPVVQLIMAYGLTSISMISRPLGSILFGKLAIRFGARNILVATLCGVALSTFAIGFIPGYASIGSLSILLLAVVRFVQGVFASGEQSIAGIFVLDHVSESTRTKASSYYIASGMVGAMLASGAATLVSITENPSETWRYAFMSGVVTGIIGILMRFITLNQEVKIQIESKPIHRIVIEY
jgi:MHS family proline/betaine transporter-like MFS transporter